MIELTRLNGNPLYVNCDLIKWAESAPDTMLTLVNGEKVVVRESCAELVQRVRQQRLALLAELLKLMPEPEAFLRAATAAALPAPFDLDRPPAQMRERRRPPLPADREKAATRTPETG